MSISVLHRFSDSVISQNLKTSRDPEHIPSGLFLHVGSSTLQYQSAHEIWSA